VNVIKFSHEYPKLWGQKEAMLIDIKFISKNDFPLSQELLDYDTKTSEGEYYPLPRDNYLQLIFLGDKRIPFCTIRRQTPQKENYYHEQLNQVFKIEIVKVEA